MKNFIKNFLPASAVRPKLLIVDDQVVNIHVLYELFRTECETFMATNGEEAIAKCHDIMPDLILLDVVMPGIDGHEVCRRLKADPFTKNIPIIFVTAHFNEEDEVECFEVGAVDFIRKPINPVITLARVRIQLALKQQNDILHSLAMMDGLTGVNNRRKFDEELYSHWLQCLREQKPLSLIMIDVDYFKKYNDCYGHQAGDDCLRAVAQAIKKTMQRPYDTVSRYGGEEFVCVLPQTDLEGAGHIARLIKSAVDGLAIEHLASNVSKCVTVSMGVATTIPQLDQKNAKLLIEAADKQLYQAKSNGRNCSSITTVE